MVAGTTGTERVRVTAAPEEVGGARHRLGDPVRTEPTVAASGA
jgi:hypothetical protein